MNLPRILLLLVLAVLPPLAWAEDLDIFTGLSGGTVAAPNVVFLLDNSPNWSRSGQRWPDNSGVQGAAELAAMSSVVGTITSANRVNVGLAMFQSSVPGGYLRFGARDMSDSTNRQAFQAIAAGISSNIQSTQGAGANEKLQGMPSKDQAAALYEIYKYYRGLAPYAGALTANPFADSASNTSTYAYTTVSQRLASGFAIGANGNYASPQSGCSKGFVIYIANNANGSAAFGATEHSSYEAGTTVSGIGNGAADGYWSDDWAQFLYQNGITVYVLDAYYAQQNTAYSTLLQRIAKVGGGKYFPVTSQNAIQLALTQIFAEIQATNSTFASASLPVNTTNRSQERNQVFIPMFRPDSQAFPRWVGNLKQYHLIKVGEYVELGDANGNEAINTLTGFPTDCAVSDWTSDTSTTFWWDSTNTTPVNLGAATGATLLPSYAPMGKCASATSAWSDSPDGPIVERGGVAEVIRRGNNPPTTTTSPTWAVSRTVYTTAIANNTLVAFNTSNTGLSATVVNHTLGQDVNGELVAGQASTRTRPSLHGDTVHSRPLPVDYGGTTGVVVYYGANDGMLRAINANSSASATGQEMWAFVAPEFWSGSANSSRLGRLASNQPLISYPGMNTTGLSPAPTPKDYFFDGSIGLYQNANNSRVWIFPVMRRGGRMIYALDVTDPAAPSIKWKVGCPNLTDNTGCAAIMSGTAAATWSSAAIQALGQTWSTPNVAPSVAGYTDASGNAKPVIVVGGGYDSCEDTNAVITTQCASPKGAMLYVIDADTGALVRSFATTRSVAGDVSLIAVANTGVVDHAYASDTGGNIYRLDFAASGAANWTMNRIAYTSGAGRKFLYAPALLPAGTSRVYLAIGSGDREHPLSSQYPYQTPVQNRFYVYLDNLGSTSAANLDDTGTLFNSTTDQGCNPGNVVLPASSRSGWFMDLPGRGEETVSPAVIVSGMAVFSTNLPVTQNQTCSTSLGEARGYWVNLFSASGAVGAGSTRFCGANRYDVFVGGSLPPPPQISVVPVNGIPTVVLIGAVQRNGGANSPIAPQAVLPAIKSNRKQIYWRSSGVN